MVSSGPPNGDRYRNLTTMLAWFETMLILDHPNNDFYAPFLGQGDYVEPIPLEQMWEIAKEKRDKLFELGIIYDLDLYESLDQELVRRYQREMQQPESQRFGDIYWQEDKILLWKFNNYVLTAVIDKGNMTHWKKVEAIKFKFESPFTGRKYKRVRFCNGCGKLMRDWKRCGGCLQAWYCSRRCHKLDWRQRHRSECKWLR